MTPNPADRQGNATPSDQESPLTPPMMEALETHGALMWRTLRLVAAALTVFGLLLGGLNLLLAGSGNGSDVILLLAGAIPCLLFAALLAGMGIAIRRRCLLDIIGQRYLVTYGELRLVRATTASALLTRGRARSYATFEPRRRIVTIVNGGPLARSTLQAAVAYTPHARYVFAIFDERGEEVYRDALLARASNEKETAGG